MTQKTLSCSLCGQPKDSLRLFHARRRRIEQNFGIFLDDLPGTPPKNAGLVCETCYPLLIFMFNRGVWEASKNS